MKLWKRWAWKRPVIYVDGTNPTTAPTHYEYYLTIGIARKIK
jgi:hypothetical protein